MNERFKLIRKHCLPEDEGRDEYCGSFGSRPEAEAERDKRVTGTGGFFKQGDYRIVDCLEETL